ncbi:MAG: UbiA prenyltransferase family protein [Actinomycetota bacterium]|nr:UbiA prenyltransferase family protein [Actinomycetota bacterium]
MFALYWRLLRYRVAVMIVLFVLLGAAWQRDASALGWPLVLAVLALASSYVSATSVNDIADEAIDEINHPRDEGRPLVTGAATTRDLWLVFGVACVLAIALALAISPVISGIMALSLLIGVLYSLPPVKLSYRTYLAPLTLAVAYVGIPFWVGVVAVGDRLGASDLPLLAALYLLFVGRIVLKDFRDREGDAAFDKPTFLLMYGKPATCLASFGAICAGDMVLTLVLANRLWLAPLLQRFAVGAMVKLYRLYRVESRMDEQLAIGMGAKMGNG